MVMPYKDQYTDAYASGYPGEAQLPQQHVTINTLSRVEQIDLTVFMTTMTLDGDNAANAVTDFKAGRLIYFKMPLRVAKITVGAIAANQRMTATTTDFALWKVQVRCVAYALVKFEDYGSAQYSTTTPEQRGAELDIAYEFRRKQMILEYLLTTLEGSMLQTRVGANAGMYGDVNLGVETAPLLWSKDTWLPILAMVSTLLHERPFDEDKDVLDPWADGAMFCYLPYEAREAVSASRLSFTRTSFADEAFKNLIPADLSGFNLIFDEYQRLYIGNVNNRQVYNVFCGNRNATLLFCTDTASNSELFLNRAPHGDAHIFTDAWRARWFFQAQVVFPDQLCQLVITLPRVNLLAP